MIQTAELYAQSLPFPPEVVLEESQKVAFFKTPVTITESFSYYFSRLKRNQDTFPLLHFLLWTNKHYVSVKAAQTTITEISSGSTFLCYFLEQIGSLHTCLILIPCFTVTREFLFILRQGVLKHEGILYKHIEQNQEHQISCASCQELDLIMHIPCAQQSNSITLRASKFSWKKSSSSTVTSSIFNPLLQRIDWNHKLPLNDFFKWPLLYIYSALKFIPLEFKRVQIKLTNPIPWGSSDW